MAVIDSPSVWQAFTYALAKRAERKAREKERKQVTRVYSWVQSTIVLMACLAGFACLTIAGFQWNIIAGWAIAGISFFAFAWLINGSQMGNDTQAQPPQQDPTLRY